MDAAVQEPVVNHGLQEAPMSCVRKHVTEAPSEAESPIEKLIDWRTEMEAQLPRGSITMLMYARNAVGAYRDKLAPGEWLRCPSCGGRGLWVDQDGGNRYCPRCSGTGILLTCDKEVPQPHAPARTGWWSWLRKHVRLGLNRSMITKRHS